MASNVIFKFGTWEKYNALSVKDPNTLYWLTDVQELWKGDVLYGKGVVATQLASGLMSAEDKQKLDALSTSGPVASLTPVDASVVITDGKIGAQISQVEGNALVLKNDGLYVSNEDKVLQSGTVEVVTEANVPYEGAVVGDYYLDLLLNDAAQTHVYIPYDVPDVDISNKVDKVITNADGSQAIIENEPSGGGAKFHAADGTQSFVGVNDGSLNGLLAQIYADKEVNGKWVGSRINVFHEHIYYTSLADKMAGKENNDASCEIATKGDIDQLAETLTWQEM